MRMKCLFVFWVGTAIGCTPDAGGPAVVAPELLEPEGIEGFEHDPELDELARLGRCEELDGQRQRECLERAQYLPEHAEGVPDDPGLIRRLDPEQADPNRRRRVLEGQEPGRTTRQGAEPQDDADRERRRRNLEQR